VIIIAKTTSAPVEADSFDGDRNGIDDVQQHLNTLARNAVVGAENEGTKKKPTTDSLVSGFLLAVRNRALVNGGSIGLKALIVTGRQATKKAPFAFFGGVNNRILISPCFPVETPDVNGTSNYNLELVGVTNVWNGVFGVSPAVTYSAFVQTPGNETADGFDALVSQTQSFQLTMGAFPNPNVVVGGTVQPGVVVGSVLFQECTQFSYFS